MKKNILSQKAISFIISASMLTTNLPTCSNVDALIPQTDELEELTGEKIVNESKNKIKQAIDNDDVDSLHDALRHRCSGMELSNLRFKHTFDFLNGKDIELPIFHYSIARKSLKCFKYLLINGICDPQETVMIPGLDIPLDAIAFAAFASSEDDYEFLNYYDRFYSYEENPAVWAAACLDHKHDLVKRLIQYFKSDDLEIPQECLDAGLFGAALGNDLYAIKKLMKNGASIKSTDSKRRTLLHLAAAGNSIEVAKFLIENHIDVNSSDGKGNTPLHFTIESNSPEVADILIQNGAMIDCRNYNSVTPLNLAAEKNNVLIFKLLRENGADIFQFSNDGMALHYAAIGDSLDIAKLLIEEGIDPNIICSLGGITPLYLAAQNNSPKVAKLLIDNGANIEAKDNQGRTLLSIASRFNCIDTVRLLIEAGADVNQVIEDIGYTPLHCAAFESSIELIELLINSGAKETINHLAEVNQTPLIIALIKNRIDVMEFLISKGADVNQLDLHGKSLLHLAVEKNNVEAVELLVNSGANVDVKDSNGKTPLDLATDPAIRSLLQGNSTSEN